MKEIVKTIEPEHVFWKLSAILEAYQAINISLDGDSYNRELNDTIYGGLNLLGHETLRELKCILNLEDEVHDEIENKEA